MKICFVNPTKGQRPIYVVAKQLADRGHTCTVLQPSGGGQRYPAWDNVQIINLPCRYVPEARYTLPPLRLEYQILRGLIQEQGYDLIHVQDYSYLTALPPIWIKERLSVPITLVNNALPGIDWQYGKWPFDQVARLYTYTLGRFILCSYDRLFFLSKLTAQQAQKLLGSNIPPWKVIPIGVDSRLFHRVRDSTKRGELGIQDSEKVILFVGRLVVVKRVELVIELTEKLLARGIAVRTIIIGGGELGNRPTEDWYHQLAQPLGQAVIFTGPKRQDELREYYSIADVVVLPSRSESFGNVLIEAGACEVPCVASDVGGVSGILQHGKTGYVFPPNDFDAFVNFVDTLLRDDKQAQKMGRQARERVTALFNWEKIVDRYEQVFRELVGRQNDK